MFPQNAIADPPHGGRLRCYEDADIGLYSIVNYACDFTTGTKNLVQSKHKFAYPNPTRNYLHFDDTLSISQVHILDTNGTIVYVQDNGLSVDLSLFPNGVYIVIIIDNNQERCYTKVVKSDH